MVYKELDKYKTGKKVPIDYEIIGTNQSIELFDSEYNFEFGNLMNDFIEHKNKPFYKRKYYHSHLTEIYIKILNLITIKMNM